MKNLLIITACIFMLACQKEVSKDITVSVANPSYTFTVQGATPPIKLYVYSKSGSPVFESTYDKLTFVWDGKTTEGNELADGMYTFLVKDNDGKAKDGIVYLVSK